MADMLSNIEIKAKINDLARFLSKARAITDQPEVLMKQVDTYYQVTEGRLKLRQIKGESSMLIFYNRPDTEGPKLSNYHKQTFVNETEVEGLTNILEASLGVIGVVRKQRHLFMVGQTRIHVDDVEQLGHFMELEVVMKVDQSIESGQAVASELMKKLDITENDLLPASYINMLLKNKDV